MKTELLITISHWPRKGTVQSEKKSMALKNRQRDGKLLRGKTHTTKHSKAKNQEVLGAEEKRAGWPVERLQRKGLYERTRTVYGTCKNSSW